MTDLFHFADDLGPAKILHVHEHSTGLKAILVIDNVACGPSIPEMEVTVSARLQVMREPVPRQIDHHLQRSRLLEQVRGVGNDHHLMPAAQMLGGIPVERDDGEVVATDDQQRRRGNGGQGRAREIRSSAA